MAGLPQSPAAYSPLLHPETALARRNEVLDLLASHDQIKIGPDKYYVPNAEEIAADPKYADDERLGPDEDARDRFREFARKQLAGD